ncbi:MAG: hypothetical protein KDD56_03140, partial [Bdellovibrionales bacterium]|nr:hypothetical protein [Bdellovibrionales bacterium]
MYSLFEVFGVELEYMIVGSDSLEIKAIADKILIDDNNNVSADVLRDAITWSNELANHVIELKTSVPIKTLEAIDQDFSLNICEINKNLAAHNALLLSGACHPFMNPKNDCYLWQHEGNEIYALYHKLFDCRAHGWVNLQSVHLNLPFSDENEFSRLHSAIRIILPLLPAIAASSPILMSKYEKIKDMRLHYYVNHQTKVKSTLGEIIPDLIQSQVEY